MSDRQWEQAAEAFDALQWVCSSVGTTLEEIAGHEIDEKDGKCFMDASDEIGAVYNRIIDIRNKCYKTREED